MFESYRKLALAWACILVIAASAMPPTASGQSPRGKRPGRDPAFAADRELFQQLLRHRGTIRRQVKNTERGVETLTESDDPEVAAMIQRHVAAMKQRIESNQPIHRRDPLFAEIFRYADRITVVYEKTAKGLRVTETSGDPYVVKLIQRHAEVVSLFIKHGSEEVHRNHDLPAYVQ